MNNEQAAKHHREIIRPCIDQARAVMRLDTACDILQPSDIRVLVGEIDHLREAGQNAAKQLDALADTMDAWANESRSGGWSTHQVDANRAGADSARRAAAQLRATACP